MNYKITCHLMPWELDYALLSFTQLKKSKYYLDNKDKIYIDVTLNLSSYLINWGETKIPKDFFINKFQNLQSLLKDYICKFKIYDGDKLFGGLNTQILSTEDHIDYYMILNPDTYFDETYLSLMIESSKHISNYYFTITSQISKLWDKSWDVITHPNFQNIEYNNFTEIDLYDIRNYIKTNRKEAELLPLNTCKWAGWMDLYNKNTWNDFWTYHKEWQGYGACDYYTLILAQLAKNKGIDFQQYVLTNYISHPYHSFQPNPSLNFSEYYKNLISLNKIPNQSDDFNSKMNKYLDEGINYLLTKHNML